MKYIAKPNLFNNVGLKEFNNPIDALTYLNEVLGAKAGDHQDYVFIQPSTSKRNLKKSIEEYVGIGKLELRPE
jgi:hypothetical protein